MKNEVQPKLGSKKITVKGTRLNSLNADQLVNVVGGEEEAACKSAQ